MVDIKIDWVSETRNFSDDYGVTRGSQLVYHIRYDLPGLDFMHGHVHTIPIQAIADHMLTLNMPNPSDALEYCILDRVAMNYLEDTAPVEPGARVSLSEDDHPLMEVKRLDESKHRVWDSTAEALSEVCRNMQASDPDTMMSELFKMIDPCACAKAGKQYLLPEMASDATGTMRSLVENVRQGQQSCWGRCGNLLSGHTLDRKSEGWQDCDNLLKDRTDTIDQERFNVFDIRYGEALKKISSERCRGRDE